VKDDRPLRFWENRRSSNGIDYDVVVAGPPGSVQLKVAGSRQQEIHGCYPTAFAAGGPSAKTATTGAQLMPDDTFFASIARSQDTRAQNWSDRRPF
jgi:hypothetical protein